MSNYNINSLAPMKFMARLAERQSRIEAAPAAPLPKTFTANEVAKALHPLRQYLTVAAVTELRSGRAMSTALSPPS